jgi:uncharacterized protein YkwD
MKLFKETIGTFLVLVLFFICCRAVMAMDNNEIFTLINQERLNNGIGKVAISNRLQYAAEQKLIDIQKYIYWSHSNPTTNTVWWYFIRQVGYWGEIGENLARNYQNSQQVIQAWLNSAKHKENLLNTKYSEIGIAIGEVAYPEGKKIVIITEYGKPNNLLSDNFFSKN